MTTALTMAQRLGAFTPVASRIEEAFQAGRITPMQRRDLLASARDAAGIGTAPLDPEYRTPKAAKLSDAEIYAKRRATYDRSRAKRSATPET